MLKVGTVIIQKRPKNKNKKPQTNKKTKQKKQTKKQNKPKQKHCNDIQST